MRLTVLSVAWPFAPVGSGAVGGAEQILTHLDQGLVRAGHNSLVVACEGSKTAGTLFSAPLPQGLLNEADAASCAGRYQAAIDSALASRTVDLVHMHGLDFHRYRIPEAIPALVTLHLPPSWYSARVWECLSPNFQLQCVSRFQRDSCPLEAGLLPVVENGVPLPPLPTVEAFSESSMPAADGEYALALGRICPEKNLHAALQAGTLASIPVLVCGKVFPYADHERYFREQIQPALTGGHHFLGPLAPERRHQLLTHARCLLLPTLAPETSSLVAMEALAAGTPVVAWRSGAIPEIIDDGVTGFLVDSVASMAEAIRSVHTLDRRACRAAAETRFSLDRMIHEYFRLYRACIEAPSPATHA